MNPDFETVLKEELQSGEKILWQAQPNADAVRSSLFSFSVLWLSGLFMLAAGVLRGAPDDPRVLYGLIGLLVMVATTGVLEIIFVPRRSERTLYVVTNQRVLTLCASRQMIRSDERHGFAAKKVLKESKNSLTFFYLSNLPAQLLFVLLAQDVCVKLVQHFDLFIAVGFALTMLGWLQPCIQDMRLPLPQFRDAKRIFYEVGDLFVFLESFSLSDIRQLEFRKAREQTVNVFVISNNAGCIRMRALQEVDLFAKTMQELLPESFAKLP